MPSIGLKINKDPSTLKYLRQVSERINGKGIGIRFLVGESKVVVQKSDITLYAVIQPNVPKMYLFGLVMIIIYLLTGWAFFWIFGAALGLTYIFWLDMFYYLIIRSYLKKVTKDKPQYISKAQIVLSLIEG